MTPSKLLLGAGKARACLLPSLRQVFLFARHVCDQCTGTKSLQEPCKFRSLCRSPCQVRAFWLEPCTGPQARPQDSDTCSLAEKTGAALAPHAARDLCGQFAPRAAIELVDEIVQVSVDDLLGGEDFFEFVVVGPPAHPLGFCHGIPDAALCPQVAPELESTPQSSVMGGFALAGVYKPVCLA